MSESDTQRAGSFWALGRNEQLILAWLCDRLAKEERVLLSPEAVQEALLKDSGLSLAQIGELLDAALVPAPFIQRTATDSGEQLSLVEGALASVESPLREILSGEAADYRATMGEDPDGRSYSELTRLEQIIARATARIQEERKKRRAFVRRKTRILSMYNPYNYLRACYWTRIGKVVLWPNEVTYGLTTNGLLDDSVQAIYDAKGRVANPIPVLTCKGWIRHFGYIPRLAQDLVDAFWPDNISIVVPKRREVVSDLMTAGIESVALMCPNEPAERLAYDVCRAGAEIVPVACTSANISGQKSITDAASAIEKFNGAVDVILTGPESSVGVNTTIIDFSSEPYTFLRAGPVSLDEVFAVVPELSGKIVDCTRKQ